MSAPPKHKEAELVRCSHPPPFAAAVSKVAVAEICRTAGYDGAEAAALRSLSDVAGRYLAALARSAAAAANARGRTECNLVDVVRAMEELALPRGFVGASDPARPLLQSAVLRGLVAFVGSVEEIPFPRPIGRKPGIGRPRVAASFAQAGRDPPFPHVPRWLPCFPESWWEEGRENGRKDASVGGSTDDGCGERRRVVETVAEGSNLALERERERVKFKLGKQCDLGDGVSRKKTKRMSSSRNWDEEAAGR